MNKQLILEGIIRKLIKEELLKEDLELEQIKRESYKLVSHVEKLLAMSESHPQTRAVFQEILDLLFGLPKTYRK